MRIASPVRPPSSNARRGSLARCGLPLALIGLLLVGCGGDASDPAGPSTPPPPPPPPPPAAPQVASVQVDPSTLALRVGASEVLQAVVRDASGNPLAGRTVTWSTSAAEVASVDGGGRVTAVAPGSATVTATSEGRTATVPVTVAPDVQGDEVGPEGGVVILDDGALRIEIPAGAVGAPTFFGAERSIRELDDPDGAWQVGGVRYTLFPEGASFQEPVRVSLALDPASLPAWTDLASLRLHRWDGSGWTLLDDPGMEMSGEGGTLTLSGTTLGFSDVAPTVPLPSLVVSPRTDHVNDLQRWVFLTVDLEPVETEHWHHFTYAWSTTGQSGEITREEGNGAEYLATKPLLTANEILDEVTVTVRARRVADEGEDAPLEVIGTATIPVRADLQFAVEFLPTSGATVFGETEELLLVIRDREGRQVQDELEGLHYTWTESGFHGALEVPTGERTRTNPAIYRARPTEAQEFEAPRVDQVTVVVEQRYRVFTGTAFNPNQFEFRFREIASRDAFVRVRVPNPLPGRLTVGTQLTGGGACVTAYVNVPRIRGATGYELLATDFGDNADPFGGSFTYSWTGPGDRVSEMGNEWRVQLEGGCATNDFAITFRQNLYRTRYENARLEVTVSEPD